MEAHTAPGGGAGGKRSAGGAAGTGRTAKRSRLSGPGAAAEGTAGGDNRKTQRGGLCPHQRRRSECKECGGAGICQHQRQRSKCKECRDEADKSMPAGLEELEEAGL